MVSALTLLQAEDSVTDWETWSYLLLADELRRVSARPAEDLRGLFSRVCFNAAVSNLDDHPRNHALLARNRQWRLSPANDLTPGTMRTETRRDLAMVCGLEGRRPSGWANRVTIVAGAGRFLLEKEAAEAIAARVFTTVAAEWRACCAALASVRPTARLFGGRLCMGGWSCPPDPTTARCPALRETNRVVLGRRWGPECTHGYIALAGSLAFRAAAGRPRGGVGGGRTPWSSQPEDFRLGGSWA